MTHVCFNGLQTLLTIKHTDNQSTLQTESAVTFLTNKYYYGSSRNECLKKFGFFYTRF